MANLADSSNEIIIKILGFLAPADLAVAELVCSKWLSISRENNLWRSHALAVAPSEERSATSEEEHFENSCDWKALYLEEAWRQKFENTGDKFNCVPQTLYNDQEAEIVDIAVEGSILATSSTDAVIKLWITTTGDLLSSTSHPDSDVSVGIYFHTPNVLITVTWNSLQLWQISDDFKLFIKSNVNLSPRVLGSCDEIVSSVVWDTNLAIGTSDGVVAIFDLYSGRLLRIIAQTRGSSIKVMSAVTSQSGRTLLLIAPYFRNIEVIDQESGIAVAFMATKFRTQLSQINMMAINRNSLFCLRGHDIVMSHPEEFPSPLEVASNAHGSGCGSSGVKMRVKDTLLTDREEDNRRTIRAFSLPRYGFEYILSIDGPGGLFSVSSFRKKTARGDLAVFTAPLGLYRGLPRLPRRSVDCSASLSAGTVSPAAARVVLQSIASYCSKAGVPIAVNLAAASPLVHHPANLLALTGETTFVTMASLFTVILSFGSVIYYGTRSAWENMEPWVVSRSSGPVAQPSSFYEVDVTGSRFFGREAVQRAVEFAAVAHRSQVRKTREPYVTHCIETAKIVEALLSPNEDDDRAEAAVITALLHDVMDDAGISQDRIEKEFGPQVASMVSRVSQLSATNQLVRRHLRLADAQPTAQEATQLRHMILTMVSEPLVIVVKLADRLHNMRTVYALAPEKQRAVAEETRRVWCTLAERLGMFALKSELEDLCFAVLQPDEYRALRDELDTLWGVRSISPAAMTPEDCCLTGECECSTDESIDFDDGASGAATAGGGGGSGKGWECNNNTGGNMHHLPSTPGAKMPSRSGGSSSWLGSAHAPLPMPPTALSADDADALAAAEAAASLLNDPESAYLSEEQLQVRDLVQSVLPFDASTFNMGRLNITPSARRGLEVLQGCARALLQEITVEGVTAGLEVSVQGRVKSLYSSFRKMARKGVPLSQVYDARALRVVVEDEGGVLEREALAACYKVLPAVHRLWRKVPGEDDDYIAMPKESGYQSLHTAVMGPGGVPMEVQIRTASMHEVAEYGKAAHWAYKERPLAGAISSPGSTPPLPESISPGHPILRISPGGQLQDGVVVTAESGGMRLLAAVSLASRRFVSALATEASPEEYSSLLQYVEGKGYFTAGQGDMQVALELYTLCFDGKYHRLDQFGHKLPTTMVPLRLHAAAPAASSDASHTEGGDVADGDIGHSSSTATETATGTTAPEHVTGDSTEAGDSEMTFMNNRIRLLRSMIEWGADIENPPPGAAGTVHTSGQHSAGAVATAPRAAPPEVEAQREEVLILVWPSGKILRVPRGTTAGTVMHQELENRSTAKGFGRNDGRQSTNGARCVNVNNRLVPAATALEDGDYVVLTKETVQV